MTYSITTKDGITINNIPDDVAPDSPDLKARVAAIRSGGGAAALEPPPPTEPPKMGMNVAVESCSSIVNESLIPIMTAD